MFFPIVGKESKSFLFSLIALVRTKNHNGKKYKKVFITTTENPKKLEIMILTNPAGKAQARRRSEIPIFFSLTFRIDSINLIHR